MKAEKCTVCGKLTVSNFIATYWLNKDAWVCSEKCKLELHRKEALKHMMGGD